MLEFDDIQHLLLTRAPALTARYEFLSFRDGAGARAWVSAIKETIHSASSMRAGIDKDKRWVTAAFTWNGLRALGLDEASLASFPEEFKQGMAARAETLGDTGAKRSLNIGSAGLRAQTCMRSSFSLRGTLRNRTGVSRSTGSLSRTVPGVEVLSVLDLHALPPFGYAHEHFGYRDRLSEPAIEGNGVEPTPGTGEPLKAGEFILGYPDEYGVIADSPQPAILARNGSYMAYRRLEEHVGKFREFLPQHGDTAEEQELVAAKLMGRWRSGAPLVLAPEKDDPALGADMQRNNDFKYKDADPHGYAVAAWLAHSPDESSRHRAQHEPAANDPARGAPFGPPLPEGAPDDGVERGIAAFVICASLIRQFEFAQNVWINDRNFNELGNERDPIIGSQDGTLEFKIPKRPIRKKIAGLPAFTTLRAARTSFSRASRRSLSCVAKHKGPGPEPPAGRKGGSACHRKLRPGPTIRITFRANIRRASGA